MGTPQLVGCRQTHRQSHWARRSPGKSVTGNLFALDVLRVAVLKPDLAAIENVWEAQDLSTNNTVVVN
jgi:hypothetical protein